MADDEEKREEERTGPLEMVSKGWKPYAIPIKQYIGVRETLHKIPWMCLKKAKDGLKNEEE